MATSYYNIGSALDDLGKPEEALFQYQKALEIRTRVFVHEHLDLAMSYHGISNVYYNSLMLAPSTWRPHASHANRLTSTPCSVPSRSGLGMQDCPLSHTRWPQSTGRQNMG